MDEYICFIDIRTSHKDLLRLCNIAINELLTSIDRHIRTNINWMRYVLEDATVFKSNYNNKQFKYWFFIVSSL